jgi:PIN domain
VIVVDTNQFDLLKVPSGALFAILRQVAHQHGHTVAIPEMVMVETLAHYRHRIEEHITAIEKGQRGLRRYDAHIDIRLPNVELMVQLRDEELRKHITVLQPPEGAAWEALQREAQRRRPADVDWTKKGAGSRDALIWLTVLHALRQPGAEPVILVTGDSDFGKGGQLHSELREELKDVGVEAGQVQLCSTIVDVLAQVAEPIAAPADLDEVLNSEQAAQAVAAALQPNAALHLLWLFRSQFSGPKKISMSLPPAEGLVPERSGRTVAYQIGNDTWVSAECTWSGACRVSLDRADTALRKPSFDILFEVDVTVLIAPEQSEDIDRVQVIDCGMPRCKRDSLTFVD